MLIGKSTSGVSFGGGRGLRPLPGFAVIPNSNPQARAHLCRRRHPTGQTFGQM